MATISPTREQRQALVDHAPEWNAIEEPDDEEARFADVVADLAADRPVADRGLLVRFLWQRVTRSLSGFGDLADERRVWYAAVRLLDQLGEDLEDIYTGRPIEAMVEAEQACQRRFAGRAGVPTAVCRPSRRANGGSQAEQACQRRFSGRAGVPTAVRRPSRRANGGSQAEQACQRRFEKLLEEEGYRPRLELIAEAWNMSLHVVERMAELYEKQADDAEEEDD